MRTKFEIANDVIRQSNSVVTVIAQPDDWFILHVSKSRFVPHDDAPITIKGRQEFAVKLVELLFGQRKEIHTETTENVTDSVVSFSDGTSRPACEDGDLIVLRGSRTYYLYENDKDFWNNSNSASAEDVVEIRRGGKLIWSKIP